MKARAYEKRIKELDTNFDSGQGALIEIIADMLVDILKIVEKRKE
jgi:hypothetical protein